LNVIIIDKVIFKHLLSRRTHQSLRARNFVNVVDAKHRGRHGIIFGWAKHLFPPFSTIPNPPLLSPFDTGVRGYHPGKILRF
jgi:hypothetical protein